MSKLDRIKVEDTELKTEEKPEELNPGLAFRSAIILVSVVAVGLLVIIGLDSYNRYESERQVNSILSNADRLLHNKQPQSVSILENLEFDLVRLKEEYADDKDITGKINVTLETLQNKPSYVKTGTQVRSWATSEIIRTELDSVVAPYSQRNRFSYRTVYQPANPTEARAYELQKAHPDWTKDDCLRIVNRKLWAGMNKVQLQAAWGQPKAVDKNYSFGNNSEQWVYGSLGPYVYLENGIVTSWQE